MDLSEIKAVDVHSHFSVHGSGIETPSRNRSLDHLLKMNAAANIAVSFVTTYEVAENGQDCDIANEETLKVARERDDRRGRRTPGIRLYSGPPFQSR